MARPDPTREAFLTPASVVDTVRSYFGGSIPLDPATMAKNPTGATRFFTPQEDGLRQPWASEGVFVSPPGGRALKPWVEKIGLEASKGVEILALLPANAGFGNLYWQKALLRGCQKLRVSPHGGFQAGMRSPK